MVDHHDQLASTASLKTPQVLGHGGEMPLKAYSAANAGGYGYMQEYPTVVPLPTSGASHLWWRQRDHERADLAQAHPQKNTHRKVLVCLNHIYDAVRTPRSSVWAVH